MKQCLVCEAEYSTSRKDCPNCGASPEIVDGFESYAPDLAHGGGGFKPSDFPALARLEGGNFWFRARNAILIWSLNKYAPNFQNLLEIGCGTGYVLAGIGRIYPGAKLNGSEIYTDGLAFASARLPTANLMQMDARRIPFIDEFDVVGAFDVLEHIKEDNVVFNQIHKALRPNGVMLLTVPQHSWLWSAADEFALHERRYSSSEIKAKVKAAGFRIIRSASFMFTLLPAMMISRAFQRADGQNYDPTSELRINPLVNSLFEKLLNMECAGIKFGLNYPLGGSRLVVAQKI